MSDPNIVHCPSGGFLTYKVIFKGGHPPRIEKVYTHEYLIQGILDKWNKHRFWEYQLVSFEKIPVPNLNGVRYIDSVQHA